MGFFRALGALLKYSEDQPRDERGRFGSGGEGTSTFHGTTEDSVSKYSEDQERDESGRWSSGGGGTAVERVAGTWRVAGGTALSARDVARLDAMRVPPAWTGVRLSPDPESDLQVVGVDSKGRTQYVYSAEHSERAAAEKFERLREFQKALPGIRRRVAADIRNKSLPRATREAAVVTHLIERTGFRVGSDSETGGAVRAYGASTLEARHVRVDGDRVSFNFVGKKGVEVEKTVTDRTLARELAPRVRAGGRLFGTTDAGVRDYVHARAGDYFKVKDFRTWQGTTTAIKEVRAMPVPRTQGAFRREQAAVSRVVAAHLGNTPAVARASYIDPAVWGRWKAAVA